MRLDLTRRGGATHGESQAGETKEYRAWTAMKRRCLTPSAGNYRLYGGRGIKVCDRWRDSYEAFLADVGRAPGPMYSLDRIDSNGNYEPSNIRWATLSEQASNRRPKQFCRRGHPLEGYNVIKRGRRCRACVNACSRKFGAKRRALRKAAKNEA